MYESGSEFAVSYGRRDGRPLINVPVAVVAKSTGQLSYIPYLGNEEFIESMTDCAP